jgi:hypothetical protein
MNISNRQWLIMSLALVGACAPRGVAVPEAMQVSGLQSEAALRDTPAGTAFASLAAIAGGGQRSAVSFGVYATLEPSSASSRAKARASALGFSAKTSTVSSSDQHAVGINDGDWSLTENEFSEGEEYVNTRLNHRGASIPQKALPNDSTFVQTARGHVEKTFGADFAEMSPYVYKVRKYLNAHSEPTGNVEDGVYQVAVSFNSTIDGLPVIGPGGKLAVDMAGDGTIVRHESGLRKKGSLLRVISGDVDLLTPQSAEARVTSRLDARGVDRSKYRISRKEFGYLVNRRSSIQKVLVPHYAFFFEPLPGTMSKVLVEVEPATTAKDVLDLLAADEVAEKLRKGVLAVPDTRE